MHGKLIAISPLILRDSTFWFLFVLALNCLWQAVAEIRIWRFAVAGLVITLVVHTRTEGWLVLVPLAGWAICRWPSAKGRRICLAAGCLLSIALVPAAVAAVNFTWLRDNPRWEFFRTTHVKVALDWWNSITGMHLSPLKSGHTDSTRDPDVQSIQRAMTGAARTNASGTLREAEPPFTSIVVPPAVPPEQATPGWILTLKLLERLAKGCTWVGGVLLLVGAACGWRILLRPEHLAVFGMNLLLLLVARIRYWSFGLDLRYFMPIVIVGTPWMALGLQYTIFGLGQLLARRGWASPRVVGAVAACVVAGAVAGSLLDGPMSAAAYMRKHADVGRWIYRRAGPDPAIAGNLDHLKLDTYFSHGHLVGIFWPRDCLLVPLPPALTERLADVVVLWNEGNIDARYLPAIEERINYCGYRRIDAAELPAGPDELMVFVRSY